MAYVQAPFTPDIPGSIVVPAHADNVRWGDNHPKVNVFHTPEEPADDVEVTPYYFSRQIWVPDGHGGWVQRRASTHGYADNDGDLFGMVPERYGAIANGVTAGMTYPADTNPSISLNLQSRSLEIEGYAHNIHRTMPRGSAQWKTTVRWTLAGHQLHGIPLDRAHNLGHQEVANNRTDPGDLDIDAIIEDAQTLLNKQLQEDEMDTKLLRLNGPNGEWTPHTYLAHGHILQWVSDPEALKEAQAKGVWPTKIIRVSAAVLRQFTFVGERGAGRF